MDNYIKIPSIQKTTKFVWSLSSGNQIEVASYMILYPNKELDGYIHCESGFDTEEDAKEALRFHLI